MNFLQRLALLITLAAPTLSATAADRPRLFGAAVPAKSAATATANPAAIRERLAAPDFTLIPDLAAKTNDQSDGPWFTLDLFDNLALDAQVMRVERTESGGIAIIARLADAELGSAVLVQNGRVLTGSVTFPGGSYSILPQADGTVSIARVAPHLLPPDGEPRMVKGAAPLAADLAAGDAPADTGKLIDVIVFWTPAAQTAAGGLAQIQNNIDTAITLTNNAYRNGGIAQRIRLVSKQAVTYTETGPDAFGNALDAITNGTIAGTAAARNTFGADEVVLVINDSAYCGIAWLPSTISSANAGQGFAIVGGGSCLTTNFSFGHELGHNMGAHHDPYVAPGPGRVRVFARHVEDRRQLGHELADDHGVQQRVSGHRRRLHAPAVLFQPDGQLRRRLRHGRRPGAQQRAHAQQERERRLELPRPPWCRSRRRSPTCR